MDNADANGAGASSATHQGADLAEALRQEIVAGALAPGLRLRQGEIGRRYGVSRTPVREALQKLHAWGLVNLAANRSAVVRPLRRRDYEGAFIVRAELEALAVERATRHLTDTRSAQLEEAVALLDEVVEHTVDCLPGRSWDDERAGTQWAGADELFHATILDAAGSARLSGTVELATGLVPRRHLWGALRRSSSRVRESARFHSRVLDRMRAGDGEEASREMHEHVLAEAGIFLEWFDRVEAEGREQA